MRPAWSAILRTTLVGTAQGMFLVVFVLDAVRATPRNFALLCSGISLLLLACGLIVSFFRDGGAPSSWRTPWRAREAALLRALTGAVAVYVCFIFLSIGKGVSLAVGAIAAVLGVALFACTGMVHAGRASVPAWRSPLTLVNFFLLGLASGLMLAVPIAVLAWPPFAGPLALAAFVVAAAAWLSRIAALVLGARPRGRFAAAVRWTFLALLFPVPGWLLGWSGGSLGDFAAAFALQFAGVLAERWDFLSGAPSAEPPGTSGI